MVETGDVPQFVDGFDERAPAEAFGVGLRPAIERLAESSEADHGATPADGGLAEDEVEAGDEEVAVDDAEQPFVIGSPGDEGVEDGVGLELPARCIAPFGPQRQRLSA